MNRKMNWWQAAILVLAILITVFAFAAYLSGIPVRLKTVVNGDTVTFTNGKTVKLWGVDSSTSANPLAKEYLSVLLSNRKLWLEYDKSMVKIWVGCESSPKFWVLRNNGDKPSGCKDGVTANELLKQIIQLRM